MASSALDLRDLEFVAFVLIVPITLMDMHLFQCCALSLSRAEGGA